MGYLKLLNVLIYVDLNFSTNCNEVYAARQKYFNTQSSVTYWFRAVVIVLRYGKFKNKCVFFSNLKLTKNSKNLETKRGADKAVNNVFFRVIGAVS